MDETNVSGVAQLERENFTDGWSENSLREELDNEDAIYLAAIDSDTGKVVAAAGLICSFDEGEILNVSVKQDYRRNHLAERIMTELVKIGKEHGLIAFTLEVRENNAPARLLYEKVGFVLEGIRPNFYSNPKEGAAIYWLRFYQ